MCKIQTHFLRFFLVLLLPVGLHAQCYELIWSEEFNYTGFPDPAIWTHETGGGGWGNNELQYYKANDEDNAWVSDGKLTITAINEDFGGRQYTSARLISRDKYSVQYGKIEARMKLPYGQGIWPAFWAMGQNISSVGWPACGEIDIMEFIGGNNRNHIAHGTAHWDNNGSHAYYGGSYTLPSGIFADDYHTFSVVWDSQNIRWYIDDIQYHIMDIRPAHLSEFHQDFFLLLNMAVGGNWPGSPDGSTVFPQTFEIDYVRVYKKSDDIQHIPVSGDSLLAPKAANREFALPAATAWTYDWSVPDDAVMVSGQGTESIIVDWGCTEGEVKCTVTGECGTYEFSKQVSLQTNIYGPMFISENQQNILFHTDSVVDTTHEWIFPSDATIISGQGSDSVYVNWGSTFENVILRTENSCGVTETTFLAIIAGQYPYPDINTPHTLPGIIEAVDFDYGGSGIAYHDTNPGNTGDGPRQDTDVDTEYNDNGSPNVGWIIAGEWLEYTLKVETDTFYSIDMRVATDNASGGPFSLLFNNEELINGITVANTGGWDSFVTKKLGTVYLTQQDTIMRIFFNSGGFNIGKITFSPTIDPTTGTNSMWLNHDLEVYPNPSAGFLTIQSQEAILWVTLLDGNGRALKRKKGEQTEKIAMDISDLHEGYYILRIETANGQVTHKKLIISR